MGYLYIACLLSFVVLTTHAAPQPVPFPLPDDSIPWWQAGNTVCKITYEDPAKAWKDSGASTVLNSILKGLGDSNWASTIEKMSPSNAPSAAHCGSYLRGSCDYPASTLCSEFKPAALYHIRVAMAGCYHTFVALHETVQDQSFAASLDVDTIVKDFGESIPKDDKILAIFSAAFGIASGGLGIASEGLGAAEKSLTGIGAAGAVISSLFALADATTEEEEEKIDPTAQLNQQIKQMFIATEHLLADSVSAIFQGGPNATKLPALSSPDGETEPIAKFFAGGKFLVDETNEAKVKENIQKITEASALHMKQGLVGSALKFQNYFIFIDTTSNEYDCSKVVGSRLIDGLCYSIQKFNTNYQPTYAPNLATPTNQLSGDQADKFASDAYKIDLVALYKNAAACQNAHPDYDGSVQPAFDGEKGALPLCFYSLPVLKGRSPCEGAERSDKLPSGLGADVCNRRESGRVIPRSAEVQLLDAF